MVLPHLVLPAVRAKVLVVIVIVAPRSVLSPVLVHMLGAAAVLVRPCRATVPSSAVVHCARQELAKRRASIELSTSACAWSAVWAMQAKHGVSPTMSGRLASVRRLLVCHARAHPVRLLALS